MLSAVIKYDITPDLLIPSRYCDNERVCVYEPRRLQRVRKAAATTTVEPVTVVEPIATCVRAFSGGRHRGVARFGQNIPATAPPRAEPRTCYMYICYDNATHAQIARSQKNASHGQNILLQISIHDFVNEHIPIVTPLQKKPDFIRIDDFILR